MNAITSFDIKKERGFLLKKNKLTYTFTQLFSPQKIGTCFAAPRSRRSPPPSFTPASEMETETETETEHDTRVLKALQLREEEFYAKLLASADLPLTKLRVSQRKLVLEWMSHVVHTLMLDDEIFFSAVSIFDRVVLKLVIPMDDVQKYALTALFISSKIFGYVESENHFEMVSRS